MTHSAAIAIQSSLLRTLRRIFRPLLRICFRAGVSMADVRVALDEAAVCEAEGYLIESGKRPTFSNISAVTGIPRRHVPRLLEHRLHSGLRDDEAHLIDASRVLNAWFDDPDFCTARGVPLELALHGSSPSFAALTSKYAREDKSAAILETLVRNEAVDVFTSAAASEVAVVRPSAIQSDIFNVASILEIGEVIGDALSMFDHNLSSISPIERIRTFTVKATVLAPDIKLLRRKLRERGEAMTLSVSETLEPLGLQAPVVRELAQVDPEALYSVRVTLFSSMLPAARESSEGSPPRERVSYVDS